MKILDNASQVLEMLIKNKGHDNLSIFNLHPGFV